MSEDFGAFTPAELQDYKEEIVAAFQMAAFKAHGTFDKYGDA